MNSKPCRKCGETKSLEEFPKHKQMADGHLHTCKDCKSVYLSAYHVKNKAKHNEHASEWRRNNPDRDQDLHAAWRAANPDRLREIRRRAHEKDKANGSPLAKRSSAKRRERQAAATNGIVSLKAVLAKHGMHCSICDKSIEDERQLTYDHVVPIARGGLHSEENLRPAHRTCNAWKGSRTNEELVGLTPPAPGEPDEWQERRRANAAKARSEATRRFHASLTSEQKAERSARMSAAMIGNTNGRHSRGKPRKQLSPESLARRAEAVSAAYAKWTPEQRAAHAAKISVAKRGSSGNVENLAKGWTPEVRAKALAASADARRGRPQTAESNAKRSASLKRAYAEGRHRWKSS